MTQEQIESLEATLQLGNYLGAMGYLGGLVSRNLK